MKRAIVTGANGFLGSYLVRELCKQNIEVIAVVRSENADISRINDCSLKTIIYCELDRILDLEKLVEEQECDYFFHLAWSGSSGRLREDYHLQMKNALACAEAAEVAARLNCKRFIGVGSITEKMFAPYILQDGSAPEMVSCYPIAKVAAHQMSKCVCAKYHMDFLWGYISNFYGVGDTTQNFINFIANNYLNNVTPELTDGTQRADFMYVSDVAKALACMAMRGKSMSSYYIGYGEPRPLKEFIQHVHDTVNPGIVTGIGKKQFSGLDIDFDGLDIGKLYRETGFKPSVTFEEGYRQTLEWIKSTRNTTIQ